MAKEEFDPQVIVTTLMGCVQETIEKMCHVTFSQNPEYVEKDIIEYGSKMRVFGMEKFNGPCYFASLNIYLTKKDFKNKNACGVIVLYMEEICASKLITLLGYPVSDEDEEDDILDNCGEFCNVIVGQFKNELRSFGYQDLIISAPLKYKNEAPEGVDFHYGERKLYELSFYLWKVKALVVDISLAPVPHKEIY